MALHPSTRHPGVLLGSLLIAACGTPTVPGDEDADPALACSVPQTEIFRGQIRDGIPALTDPELVRPETAGSELWDDADRVFGVVLDGQPIAVPLNVFWWHEVVNLERGGRAVALTHCPLTGSSLAFDRRVIDGRAFGVSGLLYRNNLIMYDRDGDTESLWPQMERGARCGPRDGTTLPMVGGMEMTWGGWTRLHPNTLVVSSETGWERDYRNYPYFAYDQQDNSQILFPIPGSIDDRRPPKERVLGVPDGDGWTAYPLGALAEAGEVVVEYGPTGGEPYVVLWDTRWEGAMAYRPVGPEGEPLTLRVVDGVIVDDETGSEWAVTGHVSGGPLLGYALPPVEEAYVAFWFAWPLFQPEIELWGES